MAHLQSYVLDAACPLVNLLESACRGLLITKDAAESAQQALKLLGHASASMSMERHYKASHFLNKELQTLVQEEKTFKDAAPSLWERL